MLHVFKPIFSNCFFFVCVSFALYFNRNRLQTGMRGAFGKPQGTVARVHIGQPIMSVRSADRYKAQVIEALRRAKFKYPGRQKVNEHNSKFNGFEIYLPYNVFAIILTLIFFCLFACFLIDLHLKEMGIHQIRSCTLRRTP